MNKEIHIDFSAPLCEKDKENQTYGCRHTNSEICKNNGIVGICALVSDDRICKRPSRAWAKKYNELMEKATKEAPN